MPHYVYEGVHYELPDGLSNEQAISKIKAHLGQPTEEGPKGPSLLDKAKQAGKDFVGGNEAALTMLAGVPAYVASGLSGLGKLLTTGDIGQAGDTVRKVQEDNFGFGAPQAITESGKAATDMLQSGFEGITNTAGDMGEAVGGNLGRANAEVAANTVLNFLPIPGAKGVSKLGKALEAKPPRPSIVRDVGPTLEASRPLPSDTGLTVDKLPQAVRDQQAIYNRTPEIVDRRAQPPVPDTQTAELPFQASPDEIVREQYVKDFTNPDDVPMQRDMFAEDQLRAGDVDPYTERLAKQAETEQAYQQHAAAMEAEQAAKRKQIEDLYSEREQAAKRATAEERALVQDDMFMKLEEELRAGAYKPQGNAQGPKTRAALPSRRPGMGSQRGAVDISVLPEDLAAIKRALSTSSKFLKDAAGNAAIVFRGNNHPEYGAEPNKGKSGFVSDNPYLASSYARTEWGTPKGTVQPFVIKSGVKVIEFPVTNGKFDKLAFDERAKRLGKNEVLIARDSYDYGPGVSNDPFQRESFKNDQYAYTDSSVLTPLYNETKGLKTKAEPSTFEVNEIARHKERIENIKNGRGMYESFTEAGKAAEIERIRRKITQMEASVNKPMAPRPGRPGMGGQGGAINLADIINAADYLKKGFISSRDYFASWKGAFHPDELKNAMKAIQDPTSKDKIVLMSPDQFHQLALPRAEPWNAVEKAGREEKQFSVRVGLQSSKGLRDIPYLRLDSRNGQTVVSAHEGRHRMDVFKEKGVPLVPVRIRVGEGVSNISQALPEKSRYNLPVEPIGIPEPIGARGMAAPIPGQGGGALIDLLTFGQANRIAKLAATSKEVIAARRANERARKAKLILGTDESFRVDMDTPEKVVAAALDGAKDVPYMQMKRGKTVTGGANRVAVFNNNPLVKWLRDATRVSLRDAENVMRQYVTNKNGLGNKWNSLSQTEKNDVWGALRQADEKQVDLTPKMLAEHGFSEKQIDVVGHIQEMQNSLFERTNSTYEYAGLKPIRKRPGHLPGIFGGDYRSLVMTRSGVDKAGKPIWKPVQYFGTDTAVGHALVKAKVEQMFQGPGFMIQDIPRRSMKETKGFSGDIGVLMDLLGKNDEAFAKVQQQLRDITAESASKLYGANLHAKEKIGVGGNEGNKFWKTVSENTNEGMKAYLRYYEDMVASHNLMKVDVDLQGLLSNEALDGMPNAKEYAKDYMRNTQGRSVGDVGNALNTLVDAAPRLIGFGPSTTNAAIHQVAKRMGQKAMGFFNIPFTVMQYLQIGQTALPEAIGLARNAKLSGLNFGKQLIGSVGDVMALSAEKAFGKVSTDPFQRKMFDFAEANGLLNFSEFADVNKVTQNSFSRKYDSFVDANRVHGEQATRPWVFFAFARLLKESGIPEHEILGTAYNKTQYAMVDYTPPELPMMYGKMGTIGKTAGSLKTFTHSFVGQQMDWVIRASKGDIAPLATGVAMMALFSGIAGTAGYQELDQLYQLITDKFGGKRQTIRETALANVDDWAKNGILSDVSNINLQSRLGSADLIPNSIWDIPSPYASSVGDMATTATDLLKNPNEITGRNAAKAWAPSSLRGPIEAAVGRGENGMSLDKEGRNDYPRTDQEWKLRYFGLTSMEESLNKDKLYNNTLTKMSDQDAQKKIVLEMKRGFRINPKQYGTSPEFQDQLEKYKARGGDPTTLSAIIQKHLEDSKKSRKQRLEGVPSGSIQSIHNYDYYN